MGVNYQMPTSPNNDKILRIDFYLVDPNTGQTIMLTPQHPVNPIDPQSVTFDVSSINPALTSLSGWYLASNVTYNLYDTNLSTMNAGAISSMFVVQLLT
jgi:hypothetical protein